MAPHLMRAQGAYKADKHATPTHAHTHKHPHTHTHTHTPQKHKHRSHGFDGNRRKKARNQSATDQQQNFLFSLIVDIDMIYCLNLACCNRNGNKNVKKKSCMLSHCTTYRWMIFFSDWLVHWPVDRWEVIRAFLALLLFHKESKLNSLTWWVYVESQTTKTSPWKLWRLCWLCLQLLLGISNISVRHENCLSLSKKKQKRLKQSES